MVGLMLQELLLPDLTGRGAVIVRKLPMLCADVPRQLCGEEAGGIVVGMAAFIGMGDQNIRIDPAEQAGKPAGKVVGVEYHLLIRCTQPPDVAERQPR